MDYFKENFNEDEWCIYLLDDLDHVTTDENLAAEVVFDKKEIYFRKDNLSLNLVLHETVHVYFSYCYLGETNDITVADMEEIAAELFADKGERMIAKAKSILEKLKNMRDDENQGDNESNYDEK